MTIRELFRLKPNRKPLLTSRPVFQHSSSFLEDDDDFDLEKSTPAPLPLFHHRNLHSGDSLVKPEPKPQPRYYLVLHILNTVSAVTSLAVFTTAVPLWNANFRHSHSLITGDYTDGLVLAPLLLSILTSSYLIITQHTSLFQRLHNTNSPKLNPRTFLLLVLTILLTLAVTLTLSATNSLALAWRDPTRTKSGLIICNLSNIFARQCQPVLYQIGGLQVAGIAFGGSAWCLWAALFVVGVRNWARERRAKRKAQMERRRRRHERRRDREHGHRQGSSRAGHDRKQRGPPLTRQGNEDTRIAVNRSQVSPNSHRAQGVQHKPRNFSKPAGVRVGSSAAQLATHKIRPKQSIQVWLNDRYVQC